MCGRCYKHLGSHIYHCHGITANEYKERFGLPHNMALITEEIYKKKSDHYAQHREKYLKNFLKASKKYRFKKGKKQIRGYISAQAKRQALENLAKINKSRKREQCPICKQIFDNLDSHLYNKHKLIRVRED